MKLAILSRNENLYSTRRLVEESKARGWDTNVYDYLKFTVEIMKDELLINYNGKKIAKPDAVIPRIGASRTFFGTAMVRHFEMWESFCANGSLSISRSRDKLRALQILSKRGIDMPKTVFASNQSDPRDIIKLVGGTPLVIKILEGTQGVGVVLAETQKAAKSVLDAFYGMNVNLLVQEFIEEASATDIRAFVVGGEVVGAMKREGAEGDFRSNLHQGGSAKAVTLTAVEKTTALSAAKAMGLDICGVDMIPSKRGPLVMEVNSSPGLEGIETATGINVAGKIMDFILANFPLELESKKRSPRDNIGA
ncbi:MAG: 30S ribosomal protein S6--L-glutamate ligase [Campylobacteraceae bacterium]|nr:30S ribosomal protein S6--L-glutamate ligase [Campylobacteraceae bacterium]